MSPAAGLAYVILVIQDRFSVRLRWNWLPMLLTVLCAVAALQPACAAGGEVELTDKSESYILSGQLDYLEDRDGRLSIEAVMSGIQDQPFRHVENAVANFSFTTSAYWFRLELRNVSSTGTDWFLESQYPLLDYIDAHVVYPGHRIVSFQSGDMRPFSQRGLKHRDVMFPLHLAQGESLTIYLRAESSGSLQVPMKLWSPQALLDKDHDEQLLLGLYYGILIGMFLYNLMIFVSIRDPSYLHYLHYLGGFLLLQMTLNGLAFEYLWPDYPWWGNIAMPFFLWVTLVGMLQFTRSFLRLKHNLPRLDFCYQILSCLFVLMMGASFFTPYPILIRIGAAGGVVGPLLIFSSGILSWRRGVRQAKYFLVAWTMLLLGCMLFALTALGLLPAVFITEYGLQIGSALEVVLLSFALANRMQILKEENERIQRDATEMLEQHVQVRTLKLEHANLELADALASLKNMQDELIRAEKMAALGSLVGGIAHELNTPIGNSITMGSTLLGETREMLREVQTGMVRVQTAEQHLEDISHGIEVLMRNLHRAAELVSSFKQVAVDRATNQSRRFDLKHTLEEIVLTLGPMYRTTPYTLELDLTPDISIESYPGPLGQIVTNFISNALAHAFDGRAHGSMCLATSLRGDGFVEIRFTDDGNGMEESHLKRVFEPFFTTKLGQGGSGLGMHIVYNLVTEVLGGKIEVASRVGEGTCLMLVLPRRVMDTVDVCEWRIR
jgi:signal transduction histidine kinase